MGNGLRMSRCCEILIRMPWPFSDSGRRVGVSRIQSHGYLTLVMLQFWLQSMGESPKPWRSQELRQLQWSGVNLALFFVINWRNQMNKMYDDNLNLPRATEACAESYVKAIDWMADVLANVTAGDPEILSGFLGDAGVAQCAWQPTSSAYNRANWRIFSNKGTYLFHGDEAKNAPGFNVWGFIVTRMQLARENPGPIGSNFTFEMWKKALTNPATPQEKKHGWWWVGRLDKYVFAKNPLCTKPSPRGIRHQLKRTVAMFICQLKKWYGILNQDIQTTQGAIAGGAAMKLQEAGITEEVFLQQFEAQAVDVGVDPGEYRGKTMREILTMGLTLDSGKSLLNTLLGIAQAA
eukprot:TRINITY_DN28747_c0_g1_i3.p1 TRINITY_DN28747_c0_g1~~TRINITY_DN28747_c0_g1_i3.p1  ORF type:complete len:349 (+),score=24.09 TRINITY_DN28747_c0_g1_i3:343-1389(+)